MDPTKFEMELPPEPLRPFVRRYLYAPGPGPALIMRPKPTGYTYFTSFLDVSPGDCFRIGGREVMPVGHRFLAGQIVDHEIEVVIARGDLVTFCEFGATGHYRMLGVPGDVFVGDAPPLSSVSPRAEAIARECFKLGEDAPRAAQIGEINEFFFRLAEQALPGDPPIERAVAMFEAANGAVRVAAICDEIGLSPRQFNRRFTHIVGVGPKFFGQILQINWVVSLLYANDAASLTEIAHEAGFYDQAHFNHAMRQFFSEGPREFLQSEHVFFKAFLGESRKFGPATPQMRPDAD